MRLFWNKSNQPADHYQIRFKAKNGNLKWKFTDTDLDENNVNISGLMAYTKYIFQVRGIFEEQEGPYGQANEDIETKKSLATTFLEFSILQNNTDYPPKYLLPIQENKNARNSSARTRQLTLGRCTNFLIQLFLSQKLLFCNRNSRYYTSTCILQDNH